MTEKQFQSNIVSLAKTFGWLCYHTYDSRRCEPGFPDLVLVREKVIFAELKTEKGKLTEHQKNFRDRLLAAGADYRLWRPSDMEEIATTLRHNKKLSCS